MNATRDIQTVLKDQVVPAGRSRYGLVIGIDRYENARLNLRCAREDAQGIYDLMIDPACGLFPKENVGLLLDEEATTQNIRKELGRLRKKVGEQDVVWIYYAGHAADEESKVYWVTSDSDVDDLYSTGLYFADFLNDIQSKRLLVLLDCCHAAAASMQKNRTRDVVTMEEVFAGMHAEGRIILSSCKPSEKAVELDDVRHGAFTHFLIQGLRGEADSRQDGVVDVDELWSYLHGRVTDAARKAGRQQTPMRDGPSTPDFPLTLNAITTQHKRKIEQTIRDHIGWDDKKELTTEEAAWCRNLIVDGPQTDDEWAVYEELENLVEGQARIATIKRLVKIARGSVALKPEAAHSPVSRACPSCGKFLKVQAHCAGKDVPCPSCKALLHVASDRSRLTVVSFPQESSAAESTSAPPERFKSPLPDKHDSTVEHSQQQPTIEAQPPTQGPQLAHPTRMPNAGTPTAMHAALPEMTEEQYRLGDRFLALKAYRQAYNCPLLPAREAWERADAKYGKKSQINDPSPANVIEPALRIPDAPPSATQSDSAWIDAACQRLIADGFKVSRAVTLTDSLRRNTLTTQSPCAIAQVSKSPWVVSTTSFETFVILGRFESLLSAAYNEFQALSCEYAIKHRTTWPMFTGLIVCPVAVTTIVDHSILQAIQSRPVTYRFLSANFVAPAVYDESRSHLWIAEQTGLMGRGAIRSHIHAMKKWLGGEV